MLLDNLKKIRFRIDAACSRADRDPKKVRLVAVTKHAPLASVFKLLEIDEPFEIGENRVQDAAQRKSELGARAENTRWRLIGHLQTNKAKEALETFDTVDSLDSLKLAKVLDKNLSLMGKQLPVLVQVKLTSLETQSGIEPEALGEFLGEVSGCSHLQVEGLMAIAPNLEPVEAVRPHFKKMRELFDKFFANKPSASLSMGMSRDFEVAVEEGATHVRVGSALFL